MLTVTDLHRRFNKSKDNSEILDWLYEHPQSFAAKKYDEINAIRVAEKMYASIMGFVNAGLELFNYREAEYLFGQERSFDINSLGRKKTVLFINSSNTNRTMDNLIILFYNQALQLLNADADATKDGRLKVPVRIIMDDFAASSTIPDFDKVISVIRSRDISVSLIIQSLSQLQSLYDSAVSSTIINNCDHLIYMGSQDIDTANFISARTCMTPESVLRMPRDRVCVITNGEKARWVEKIQPYSTTVYFDPVEVSGECFM